MKKIIALTAISLMLISSNVFAAALATGGITADNGLQVFGGANATQAADATTSVLIGKASNGVRVGVNYANTCYALVAKHDLGSKGYGTAMDSTAMYNIEWGVGTLNAQGSAPSACDNSSYGGAGWTEM